MTMSTAVLHDENLDPITAANPLPVDATLTLPNEGQQTMANSISVAVASDQSAINTSADLKIGGTAANSANPVPVEAVDTVPYNVAQTGALAASLEVTTSGEKLYKAYGKIDTTAATDVYYIQFIDANSLPADGAVTHAVLPQEVNHTTGTSTLWELDLEGAGVQLTNGLYIVASTTEFNKTIAGSVMSACGLTK